MMKVCYVANHHNPILDDTEGHITYGFKKLGHEVIEIMEGNARSALDVEADFFLFHHWDVPERLEILSKIKYPKAFWCFDKIWRATGDQESRRMAWVEENLPYVDLVFLNDWSFALEYPNPKFRELKQGIGDRLWEGGLGKSMDLGAEVCFTGTLYGVRGEWADQLKEKYGNRFRAFMGFYNRDLFNLCAGCKIMLCPQYPVDNNYWGNRVYLMTGSGGFTLHAYCERLSQEFKDGEEIVFYKDRDDMFKKIDYYLAHDQEREKIRLAGFKRAKELSFTFRVGQMLEYLKEFGLKV